MLVQAPCLNFSTKAREGWNHAQVDKTVGVAGPPELLATLHDLAATHHPATGVGFLRAYHAGQVGRRSPACALQLCMEELLMPRCRVCCLPASP